MSACSSSSKRKRKTISLDEKAAILWAVTAALLQKKARDFACIMEFDSFVASAGWLQRFKVRDDIVGKVISGECQSVDKEEATAWVKSTIGPLLERYDERDVFNADETGLFFSNAAAENSGGKQSKVRITVLLCANMDGSEKVPPLAIGKSATLRCFKGKQKLKTTTEKKTLRVNPGKEQIRHTMG
ncbi:hypothetical protein HPB47_012536 [Ixodes persulcatus]|uniref:Uncharacterized protein n=1 Tax=Ixodes persulcatus TaxID=34615 RepID=A0AC60NTE8_IXOPE|nr:hypothetical protein HPB47_012536 [Ixodes persulcatus]